MTVPIDRALVGFVDSPVAPSDALDRRGTSRLETTGPFRVREHVTLRIVHTVGHHGLDDRGAMKIVLRFPADGGAWQGDDPTAPNYVSVSARRTDGGTLPAFRMRYEAFGNARPWFKVLTIQVVTGCLSVGDEVILTLGDRSGGSPGLRLQTFCESPWELRFLVDACATGHFVEVPGVLAVDIGPEAPVAWRAVIPTRWPVGVPFRLGVRADDRYGNPTDLADRTLELRSSAPLRGLPTTATHTGFATHIEGLIATEPGLLRISVRDSTGALLSTSNPMVVVTDSTDRTWWGDLHGQSGETVGINPAEHYFEFARDRAFLDLCAHQANDFQITNAFWSQLDGLSARFHEPHRFVTFPGFEWSGNTAVGGDRNIYFRSEGRPIRRSSHALLTDRTDIASDCTTARELFAALRDEDAVAYAHVGGRWADLAYAHDGVVERAVEIHSDWGTFEWLLLDAVKLGHRVGVVANSDGHKGRPGASHPGAATFGAFGGLTGFSAPELTRDAIFAAIRGRRTIATTGCRLDFDVVAAVPAGSVRFADDPALGPTTSAPITRARIGDIVQTPAANVEVEIQVAAASAVHAIDVMAGATVVGRWRPPSTGRRVGVRWEGAKYRGRGREVAWDGRMSLTDARLKSVTRINAWNPDHGLTMNATGCSWQAITTGNFGGLDLDLDEGPTAALAIETIPARATVALVDLDADGLRVDAGGLGLALSVFRLPEFAPTELAYRLTVPLAPTGDTSIWVRVTLADGHRAWSSPIWLFRTEP